jgi:hypothetical protein
MSTSDLLFIPLEVVKEALCHVAETDWTYQLENTGMKKMNCFATYGTPAKNPYFWRRKCYQKSRDRSFVADLSDASDDVEVVETGAVTCDK